jgi:hypothetical protein
MRFSDPTGVPRLQRFAYAMRAGAAMLFAGIPTWSGERKLGDPQRRVASTKPSTMQACANQSADTPKGMRAFERHMPNGLKKYLTHSGRNCYFSKSREIFDSPKREITFLITTKKSRLNRDLVNLTDSLIDWIDTLIIKIHQIMIFVNRVLPSPHQHYCNKNFYD